MCFWPSLHNRSVLIIEINGFSFAREKSVFFTSNKDGKNCLSWLYGTYDFSKPYLLRTKSYVNGATHEIQFSLSVRLVLEWINQNLASFYFIESDENFISKQNCLIIRKIVLLSKIFNFSKMIFELDFSTPSQVQQLKHIITNAIMNIQAFYSIWCKTTMSVADFDQNATSNKLMHSCSHTNIK